MGDGRSGKTSLANRLRGTDLPQEEDRTQGVDIIIGEYYFPLANGKEFKLNIWDFAGQDKYKTLPQMFYTESSLYVMVAESGKNTTDFDDWLQTAELFGEGSPLLLVLNEFKDGIGMGSFDENHWKKQFPTLLKDVLTTNLKTKTNFSQVEQLIQFLAQNLPHTKYEFPSNWAAIRRELNKRRNKQFISIQEYLEICRDNDLPEEDSALILSSVLHKIGDCLHYQKSELLKQFIILKNEWATDAVYTLLDDQTVADEKCGFFDWADVERIWDSEEYKYMRPQLLELMQQFKLAYQLPGRKEYVTPPLLPQSRPEDYEWPEQTSLELYLEYEFLPKALFTQFIVSRHADIDRGRTLVWRNGVVLRWKDEGLAEVTRTKLRGLDAIYIRSQGKNRKGLMTVILKTFRELHAEYKGIKYQEKVPCNCEGCTSQANKQYYFNFATLQKRLERGRRMAECDESFEEIPVSKLLENNFVFDHLDQGRIVLKEKVERTSGPNTRILNIFLASSNELQPEREKIEIAISQKNKDLRKEGFYIDLLIWENEQFIGNSFRSQDNYNQEVDTCDVFVMLFHSKVGKFSLEEFDKAKARFDESALPRMVVFEKDTPLPNKQSRADSESRHDFLERLKKAEHFTRPFGNTDALIRELDGAIDKLLKDQAFVNCLKAE